MNNLNCLGKWYMPEKYYPHNLNPRFLFGAAYVMVGNLSHLLLKTIEDYDGYVVFIDDVFITGIIAAKADIKRFQFYLFVRRKSPNYCSRIQQKNCVFCKMALIIQCNDDTQTTQLWTAFKSSNESHKTVKKWPPFYPSKPGFKDNDSDIGFFNYLLWICIAFIVLLLILTVVLISYDLYEYFK